ncbi:MAG: MCP four helix bundle domain-containing protein, partial [Deltaproteobacteria bacterium]|nr:MCP four helix bundle domain-containing protein [Deltaproteobacteria bacterium]
MKNFFLNLNISRKLGIVFLALLVMMGIGGSIGLYNAKQIARFSAVLYGDYFKRLETLSTIERELLITRQDVFRHITASARGAKAFLNDSIIERDKNIDNLIKEHTESEEGRQSKEEEKVYKDFEAALRGYREIRTKVLALSEDNKEKEAVALANGDAAGKFEITINSLKSLIDEEKDLISREYQKSEYSARMITVVTIAATIAAVILSLGLWIALTRSIVSPILRLEASHELRTPLNSIIGFSELLHEKSFGDLNQKQFQYVEYIHGSGRHLLDLINNILDLSKIEAGKVELHLEEFELVEVLGDILGTIKPIAAKKDVIVESKDIKVSQIIKADKAKFKQIMLNLLSNAVKFNKKGGRVDVDWNIVEDKGDAMARSILVSVKDTGIGIKKEDFPKVFREFEQIDASITREYGGTGLGMALTKKLVELHGGRIWLESEAGKGTQISFVLPQEIAAEEAVYKKAEEMPAPKVSRIIEEEPPPLILVAGESPDINELLKEYLVSAGYNVQIASDGLDVVRKAKEFTPFAIALGIKIPKKDGWEVIKELKETPETSNIPVIIVSSSNNKERGFSLGAVDHITKPIDKNMLLGSLGRMSLISKTVRRQFT